MEQGTIVRWLHSDGDEVDVGDELVEIETDKATVSYESELAGILQIVAAEGETVPVGATIAEVGGNGARPSRAKASPVARRLADSLGVELGALHGTGPGGRIVKRDVQAASPATDTPAAAPERPPDAPAPAVAEQPADGLKGEVTVTPLSSIQSTIARRMAQAKSTMPDFTLTTEVEMDRLARMRSELGELDRCPVPSINDFVVRACALALRRHPKVNSSYRNGAVERYHRINVGVAVAAADVLLVPTVFDADKRALHEIAEQTRALAQRARDGALSPPQLAGGTFTVSNLGMFGITQFTAVLNPPQVAILAVGSLREQVRIRDGEVAAGQCMTLTLTCDHRVLYGADGAEFLSSVRTNLEQPLRLAL
jgi:pyruvate dehydrogenase E2 component (dihydrolipoamide acetyltransferase)